LYIKYFQQKEKDVLIDLIEQNQENKDNANEEIPNFFDEDENEQTQKNTIKLFMRVALSTRIF
jgi:hypothetical protein